MTDCSSNKKRYCISAENHSVRCELDKEQAFTSGLVYSVYEWCKTYNFKKCRTRIQTLGKMRSH